MAEGGDLRRGGGHLPAGHSPGPQSRRVARGWPIAAALLTLGVAGFIAGGVALLINAPNAKSPSGARIGAIFFFAAALALVALMAFLRRRRRPRQARHLELRVEPIEVRRGDTVTATLVISDPQKLGEKLDLGLVCSEFYDVKTTVYDQNGSHEQRVTRTAEAVGQWRGADRAQPQQTVSFTVPPDAPFSYEGTTVSWAWRVSAIDRHAQRLDAHRDVAIWVSP